MEHQAYIFDSAMDPACSTGWGFVDGWPISGPERIRPSKLTDDQKLKFHLAKITTNAQSVRPLNPYPDLMTYNIDMDLYSSNVVDVIEELEPNVHEIFPLIIVDEAGGAEIRRDYHYLHLAQYAECVDESATKFMPEFRDDEGMLIASKRPTFSEIAQVTVFADAIKGRHIWRDPRYDITRFCSAEFKRKLEGMNIGGYAFYPCLSA